MLDALLLLWETRYAPRLASLSSSDSPVDVQHAELAPVAQVASVLPAESQLLADPKADEVAGKKRERSENVKGKEKRGNQLQLPPFTHDGISYDEGVFLLNGGIFREVSGQRVWHLRPGGGCAPYANDYYDFEGNKICTLNHCALQALFAVAQVCAPIKETFLRFFRTKYDVVLPTLSVATLKYQHEVAYSFRRGDIRDRVHLTPSVDGIVAVSETLSRTAYFEVQLSELDHLKVSSNDLPIAKVLEAYGGGITLDHDAVQMEKSYRSVVTEVSRALGDHLLFNEDTMAWEELMDPVEILTCLAGCVILDKYDSHSISLDLTRDIQHAMGCTVLPIRWCEGCSHTECGRANPSFTLSLTCPGKDAEKRKDYTIDELLPQRSAREKSTACGYCGSPEVFSWHEYRHPSPYLVIGAVRYAGYPPYKLKTPDVLTIPFHGVTPSVNYRLNFVITYLQKGHYVAYVRNDPTGDWFQFDEDVVKCLGNSLGADIEKTGNWYGFSQVVA